MFSAAAAAVQSLADWINDVHVFDFNTVYDASTTDDGVDVASASATDGVVATDEGLFSEVPTQIQLPSFTSDHLEPAQGPLALVALLKYNFLVENTQPLHWVVQTKQPLG